MITVRGNVLDAFEKDGPVVILQQVNCQGVMGSGVAEALRQSLMNLKYGLDARCLTDENVHHPMIGAGLGGGDWEVIQPIIENIIGFRTTLWVL